MVDTGGMQKGERLRFVVIVGLAVAVLSAGFALAGDAFEDPSDEPTTCEPVDAVEEGDTVGEGQGSGEGEDPTQGEGSGEGENPTQDEACADGAGGTGGSQESVGPTAVEGEDAVPVLEVTEARAAECTEAAGSTPEDAPEEKPTPGELKGLENAIAHVLWNCMRNDNDGLVKALEHLSANLERKELRDEAKAERKADREAARAERKAEHEAAKLAREAARAS